jgi:hypothetical protein
MKKSRLFRLRNGAVVREYRGNKGFAFPTVELTVIEPGGKWKKGEKHALLLMGSEFPCGGSWGPDYDIVEEIKE